MTRPPQIRVFLVITALGMCAWFTSAAQVPQAGRATSSATTKDTKAHEGTTSSHGSFRIAGVVASKTDGQLLAHARVIIREASDQKNFRTVITSDGGKFEFTGLAAGKYSLEGEKRGFIAAGYDQHDQFSTAIVTGAGLDTEHLVLKLAPDALIGGTVLDEAGEPVRHAIVALYRDDHNEGVDEIRVARNSQTDDLGSFELTPLAPGTYFLSVTAKPWYAVHPRSEQNSSSEEKAETAAADQSLNVAYPVTYYPDVTDADSAAPILIRGGEHLQLDLHVGPVPAITVTFYAPPSPDGGFIFPRLEQPAFDGSATIQTGNVLTPSPGVWQISGIPAGRYDIRSQGSGTALQMTGVDLSKNGDEIDASKGEALSTVKISAQAPGDKSVLAELSIGLQARSRTMANIARLDAKGDATFQDVASGRYEIVVFGSSKPYAIVHASAEGAEVSGHTLVVTAGSSPALSLTLAAGNADVEGVVKRAGKGFAGAMVVLVPKDPEKNRDLFRRDQSDLDGTFSLHGVIPGSYTIVAIENGWDLDWSRPEVIASYARRGQSIVVGDRTTKLAQAVELQSK